MELELREFPINSPIIEKIVVEREGRVRRSRIFYMRQRFGKKLESKKKEESRIKKKEK